MRSSIANNSSSQQPSALKTDVIYSRHDPSKCLSSYPDSIDLTRKHIQEIQQINRFFAGLWKRIKDKKENITTLSECENLMIPFFQWTASVIEGILFRSERVDN